MGSVGCAKDLLCISASAHYCSYCLHGCGTLDAHQKRVIVEKEGVPACLPAGPHPPLQLSPVVSEHRAELHAGLPSSERLESVPAEQVEGGCADSNRTESQGLSPRDVAVMGLSAR